MDDDFNTANAIAAIFELVEACKCLFIGKKYKSEVLEAFH